MGAVSSRPVWAVAVLTPHSCALRAIWLLSSDMLDSSIPNTNSEQVHLVDFVPRSIKKSVPCTSLFLSARDGQLSIFLTISTEHALGIFKNYF